MTILSDIEIKELVDEYNLIKPFIDHKVSTGIINGESKSIPSYGLSHAGYDIRLQPKYKISTKKIDTVSILDNSSDTWYDDHISESVVIPPHGFLLGVSVESFNIPKDIVGILLSKSTLIRMGLFFSPTYIEPGWRGELVVEMFNANPFPVEIYANVGIGQIVFQRLSTDVLIPYTGKYQHQTGIQHGFYGAE